MEIKIKYEVPIETIEALLDSAGRGASYWAESRLQYEEDVLKVLHGNGTTIRDVEEEPTKTHRLTLKKVKNGLAIMAQKDPEAFAEIVAGDADNNTGDVFLQYALFGEQVYS